MSEVEAYSSIAEELQQEIRALLSGTQDPALLLRHNYTSPPKVQTSTHDSTYMYVWRWVGKA